MNELIIEQLSLVYPNKHAAISNINLTIRNGMFGLLGPNGAGKSSLMKMIAALQKPSTGTIHFNGVNIHQHPLAIKKHLGYLPQDFGVYPKVSAYQLLQHIAVLKGLSDSAKRKAQLLDLLEKVNLAQVKDQDVHTFSGGMRQRFGVAQALLGNPTMVLVDEPTAGLDPEERNRFNMLLSDISEEVIVLLSTHLVEDVQHLCNEIAILFAGELIQQGKPAELLQALQGKIWTKQIAKHDLEHYRQKYQVIQHQLSQRQLFLQVYADHGPEGFTPAVPTLEHVYFKALQDRMPAVKN